MVAKKALRRLQGLALYKNKKIRPVLHMSSPKGQSFNAAIDMLTVQGAAWLSG
jgi:hypothetical protein